MLPIPSALQTQFEEYLRNKATPNRLQWDYKKWLRYYLDFCQKYKFSPTHKESLPQFIRKLQEKKQSKDQQGQAVLAIKFYYEVVTKNIPLKKISLSHPDIPLRSLPFNDKKPLYVREVSKSPIQYKMVAPPLSRDVATIKQGFSRAFSPSGKASVGLGSGPHGKTNTSGS